MTRSLSKKARDILLLNDHGGYTVPAAELYPYQWNWDSAFVALGFAVFNHDRAWQELETLFSGQWDDGFLPHIIFHVDDSGYFPGAAVWGTNKTPQTSGITQPPVAASVTRWLLNTNEKIGKARAAALYPKLLAWHRWFHTYRDPLKNGLVLCVHPWESGRDNSPEWDAPAARVDTSSVEPYRRRDLALVDQGMRPSNQEYDQYIALLQHGRSQNWNHAAIADTGPFRVFDVGMSMILLRANRDLLALADRFGTSEECEELQARIKLSEDNIHYLWSDAIGAYGSRDAKTGNHFEMVTSASFLAFYAGVGGDRERAALMANFERIDGMVRYMMPSFDPAHPKFDPIRYWCGPIWAVVNKMIALGLIEMGHTKAGQRIVRDTCSIIEQSGFRESYSPVTGEGTGGSDFSWTAAIWLHLSENRSATSPGVAVPHKLEPE
ncbi:MAG: hypothetical protein GDA39_04455 [Hyphomonadaceae bacterium]|nr:hypothetical protein [Hyphomonadaceae bacterium]MBC6412181.1 hypothetical protein [Hyphomonadaceae bacterium]